MAKVCIVLPQSDITVTNSIARNIVKDLIKLTGFPSDAKVIMDSKQGGTRALAGFTNPCEIPIRPEKGNYVFVTVTERYSEDVQYHQPHRFKKRVFKDPDLGVYIDPIYSSTELELAIRFRTRDLTTMRSWVSAMRVNQNFQTDKYHHAIKYDYPIPVTMIDFIVDAWKLSEAVAPRGKTLKEFVIEGFDGGLIKRKNLSGTHSEFVVNELQTGVAGFKLAEHPYNEYTVEDGICELQYPYKINIDRIDALTLQTPIIIHNQFIADRYVNLILTRQNPGYEPFGFRDNGWLVDDLEDDTFSMFYKGDGGARLIGYDDFFPELPREGTSTVFLSPVQVNLDDPHVIMNITELEDKHLPKEVKAYITMFPERAQTFRSGLISIELYEIFSAERRLEVTIDSLGNVRSKAPMYPQRRNYVKVDILKDFSIFNTEHTTELLKQGTVLKGLCLLLSPTTTFGDTGKEDIREYSNGELDGVSYTRWLKKQKGVNRTFREHDGNISKTKQLSSLIARRN